MTWFKVDDSFHAHPKVLATDAAALGLWVVAGAWSSAHLTDGFVPDHALLRLLPDSATLARELVTAGLWRKARGGYRFHDWNDFQPAASDVRAVREKRAEAGRLGGLASARSRAAALDADSRADEEALSAKQTRSKAQHEGPSSRHLNGSDQEGRASKAPSKNEAFASAVVEPPTRPDPKKNKTSSSTAAPSTDRQLGTEDDPQFARFWDSYPRRIGKGQARKAWVRAVKSGTDPEAIIAAAGRFTALRGNEDPKFTAYPATWLNGERWADVPDLEPRPAGPVMPWELWDE